ncbi:BRCA1-associated RING domain protein 1 [Pelomyxa schiedti]|nr:BRCA1-associated RING domain protein 1 [Pelomyxa schiedti]
MVEESNGATHDNMDNNRNVVVIDDEDHEAMTDIKSSGLCLGPNSPLPHLLVSSGEGTTAAEIVGSVSPPQISLKDLIDNSLVVAAEKIYYVGYGLCLPHRVTVSETGLLEGKSQSFPTVESWLKSSAIGPTAIQNTTDLWTVAATIRTIASKTRPTTLSEIRDFYMKHKDELNMETQCQFSDIEFVLGKAPEVSDRGFQHTQMEVPVFNQPELLQPKSALQMQTTCARRNIVIVSTSIQYDKRDTVHSHLRMTTSKCGGKVVCTMSSEVTHIVTEVHPETQRVQKMTLKYACGVLAGCWILSYQWVIDSFKAGRWLDEARYEASGDPNAIGAPMKGRLHKERMISAAAKGLFSDHLFYFSIPENFHKVGEHLAELVKYGQGTVLTECPPAPGSITQLRDGTVTSQGGHTATVHVVTHASGAAGHANEVHAATGWAPVSHEWVLHCVSSHEVLDASRYITSTAFGGDDGSLQDSDTF